MADEPALGKPLGGDLREGKVTLPVILLLQRTGPEVAALIQEIVHDGAGDARGMAWHQGPAGPARGGGRRVRTGGVARRARQDAPPRGVRTLARARRPGRARRLRPQPRSVTAAGRIAGLRRAHPPPRRAVLHPRRAGDFRRRVRRPHARARLARSRASGAGRLRVPHAAGGRAAGGRLRDRRASGADAQPRQRVHRLSSCGSFTSGFVAGWTSTRRRGSTTSPS